MPVLKIGAAGFAFADEVAGDLDAVATEVDDRAESIGKKIREGELRKAPYMLVVGDREAEAREVAVRKHTEGDQGSSPLDEFAAALGDEVARREG